MIGFFILVVLILVLFFNFLKNEGFRKQDAFGLILGIFWCYLFFTYGSKLLNLFNLNTNAADFFIIYSFIFWGGLATSVSLPFFKERDFERIKKIFVLFIGTALIYMAIDNVSLGPPAVGEFSPYKDKDICNLDPTYYAEDVWAGCYLVKKLGLDPYSEIASFIVYVLFTLVLFVLGLRLVGIKKTESVIFGR